MKMNKLKSKKNEVRLLTLLTIKISCLFIVGKKRINLTIRNNRKALNTLIPLAFELFIKLLDFIFSITSQMLIITMQKSNTL